MSVEERISEILGRYPKDHPVNKAIQKSQTYLRLCSERAEAGLGRLSR